jgi:predicted HTH transcriptional regulator
LDYFCDGVADRFEHVKRRAGEAAAKGQIDRSAALRRLDPRQRKALDLYKEAGNITSRDVAGLFGISERAARDLLAAWVDHAFLTITDPAKKSRKYGLKTEFKEMEMGKESLEKRAAR